MTDKEIIIDGVDVSRCKEYIWALSHVCNLVNGRTDKFQCNYYPNCYFKQLKRKEQECEKLKEENQNLKNMYDSMSDLCEIKDEAILDKNADIEELNNNCLIYSKKISMYETALNDINAVVSGDYETLDPLAKQELVKIVTKVKDNNGVNYKTKRI